MPAKLHVCLFIPGIDNERLSSESQYFFFGGCHCDSIFSYSVYDFRTELLIATAEKITLSTYDGDNDIALFPPSL